MRKMKKKHVTYLFATLLLAIVAEESSLVGFGLLFVLI